MSQIDQDGYFFDKERDKLTREITSGFEDLLSSTNVLNRKLEEIIGMTKEYETIAALWKTFHNLMRGPAEGDNEKSQMGLPGTGGHVIAMKQNQV